MAALVAVVVAGVSVVTVVSAVSRRIAGPYARTRVGPDVVIGAHMGGARQTIEELRDEVDQLRGELADVRARLGQVDELQERVDFAERMLAQVKEKNALPGPR